MSTGLVILRVLDLVSVILTAADQLQRASAIMNRAREEDREISDAEWQSLDDLTANALSTFKATVEKSE